MARRKPKEKLQLRVKRTTSGRLSRTRARVLAKPKKSGRNGPAKRGKSGARRRVATQAKSATRRKASTHKKPTKRVPRKIPLDPRLEIAVKGMNRGSSLTAAARSVNLPPKSLETFVRPRRLAKRKGRRWVIKDNRLRRVPVITKGRIRLLTVRGYQQARLVGEHYNAAGDFVRTNDVELIDPFKGCSVQTVKGKQHPLETDPNELHRIAAMDTPPFHEIYEIISTT